MRNRLILAVLGLVCVAAPAIAEVASAVPYGFDLQGKTVELNAEPANALVMIFVASDCPISKRYLPNIESLAQTFSHAPVSFRMVYPNPQETAQGIQEQVDAYHVAIPVLLDPTQSLVVAAGANTTPEAVIFLPVKQGHRREVFRGRIDDRYLSFGHQRPNATKNELEIAIHAVLEGKPVPAAGRPVGCAIVPRSMATP